jgi:hypothetical protein
MKNGRVLITAAIKISGCVRMSSAPIIKETKSRTEKKVVTAEGAAVVGDNAGNDTLLRSIPVPLFLFSKIPVPMSFRRSKESMYALDSERHRYLDSAQSPGESIGL